jgi:DNA-binding phage protein
VNTALTRDFKETVVARVQNDPAFAQALLDEAITLFVNGEPESAKLILRDLVNATVGFEALAEEIDKPAKSLHRMLSKSGNPTMSNISAVFAALKRALKVEVHTQIVLARLRHQAEGNAIHRTHRPPPCLIYMIEPMIGCGPMTSHHSPAIR